MRRQLSALAGLPVLRPLRDARDRLQLSRTPPVAIHPNSLRRIGRREVEAILSDPSVAQEWLADNESIRAVLPDRDIPGGLNPGERRALYHLIRGLNPSSVLEIGTHIGASTLHIARALLANGRGGRITTVDISDVNHPVDGAWAGTGLTLSPREMARKLGCLDTIDFVTARSLDFLARTEQRFDLVFLDGDHKSRAVYQEVAAALGALAPGGLILLHDFFDGGKPVFPDGLVIQGPYRGVGRVTRECPALQALPLGALPWPTKQGVSATCLALLTCADEQSRSR
jgi:predicted O-methyltransferase YrrM